MRTIYVTDGRTGYATATLTDARGNDLTGATFRMAVSPAATKVPPASTSTDWHTPDLSTGTGPTRELSLLLTEAIAPPGVYWLWVDVTDSPEVQPVRATNEQITTL